MKFVILDSLRYFDYNDVVYICRSKHNEVSSRTAEHCHQSANIFPPDLFTHSLPIYKVRAIQFEEHRKSKRKASHPVSEELLRKPSYSFQPEFKSKLRNEAHFLK